MTGAQSVEESSLLTLISLPVLLDRFRNRDDARLGWTILPTRSSRAVDPRGQEMEIGRALPVVRGRVA